MTTRLAVTAMVLTSALALGACGDDDDSDDFASQGNEICKAVNEKFAALPRPTDLDGLAKQAREAVRITDENLPKLRELDAGDDQAKLDQYADTVEANRDKTEEVVAAAEDGDEKKVQSLATELQAADRRNDKIATDIGLTECTEEPGG